MRGPLCSLICLFLGMPGAACALDIRGDMGAEGRLFLESPAHGGQHRNTGSLSIEAEFFEQIGRAAQLTVQPFYRYDSANSRRSHGDLKQCNVLYLADLWELRIGLDKVFWGVTEFVHLVDIINQTDLLEGLDGEDKLGQPMVHLRLESDWGMLDSFLLPWFRHRAFPGRGDRLRGPVVIDGSHARFESSAEEQNFDLALRFSHSSGNWDFGLAQFLGTSREPLFIEKAADSSLIPYYEQVAQTSLDLQLTQDRWLWKLETVFRLSSSGDDPAAVFGFEYTLPCPALAPLEIGLLVEYVYDERGIAENSLYDRDLMGGIRVNLNDQGSRELLVGLIWDTEKNSTAVSFELSSRMNNFFTLELSGIFLGDLNTDDPVSIYRQDSFMTLAGVFYF